VRRIDCLLICLAAWITGHAAAGAEPSGPEKPVPGSMIEDRAAGKLIEAGLARLEADEPAKAVEIWQSVIERYPRSRVRFTAHMCLGKQFLERERAYDRARVHFEVAASKENRDEDQRAEAMMRTGACYYHLRNQGKCFQVMRDMIDLFPASPFVNDAYYYIGLGHFQLGHYSRAIAALENVGTAMSTEKGQVEKLEAGKRLFVRIEDADLGILDPQQAIEVQCEVASGDREVVKCFLIARNTRLAIGSLPTRLGKPSPGNGQLEVKGDDKVKLTYIDQHTAEKEMNRKVERTVEVVGSATARITDGAFSESLLGAVLGKELNVQVTDPDRDLTDQADTVKAIVVVYRPKTDEEVETEALQAKAQAADASAPKPKTPPPAAVGEEKKADALKEIDRREIVLTEVRLPRKAEKGLEDIPPATPPKETKETPEKEAKSAGATPGKPEAGKAEAAKPPEANVGGVGRPAPSAEKEIKAPAETKAKPETGKAASDKPIRAPGTPPEPGEEGAEAKAKPEGAPAPAAKTQAPTQQTQPPAPATEKEPQDNSVHSGYFRLSLPLEKSEKAVAGDQKLQALPGDLIRVVYVDQRHRGEGPREVTAQARCLEGNIGAVRVSHAIISDQELRIQTELKTASALTNIGNRYKEFGLKKNAEDKYKQGLTVCEEIMKDATKLGGRVLEETYVQLWRIYFEMDRLDLAAAMCQRLQQQFPSSGFVDEALLQLAEVARKQNDLNRAIHTYSSLLAVRTSPLRGEAQFGIAQCYDQMAKAAEGPTVPGLRARAFEEYKKVFDQFPDSGRVGDAVAKMAEYYYDQKDYARATEVFENVIANHPDAKFLDVILFNYGRCLFRMDRKPQALAKFEQLLGEFPDSPLAADTTKIIDAMRKAGK
jgi:tetratricopeptide (TPR) repeat protein